MILIRTAAIAILVAGLSGCYSSYTGIAKNADGSYNVTKNVAPFFGSPYGELLRCKHENTKMSCKSIDRI